MGEVSTMKRIVRIQNVGNVGFPDSMTDEEVSDAAGKLHAQANPAQTSNAAQSTSSSVIEFLARNRRADQSTSEHLKALAGIARALEENPTLARLAIVGLQALSQNNLEQ
jgi:hypothetical protein